MIRRKPLMRKTPLRAKSPRLRRSKSKTNYKKRLWEVFSAYIRKKYADHTGNVQCVTCGKVDHWKKLHAGHYIAKSLGTSIYFDERNVHPQCVACNLWRHGNLANYALFLVRTYGPGILEELSDIRHTTMKIPEDKYLEMIADYRARAENIALPEAA